MKDLLAKDDSLQKYTYRFICVTVLAIFSLIQSLYVQANHICVTVTDADKKIQYDYYSEVTVSEVLADAGIILNYQDSVNLALDTVIKEDTVLDIMRGAQQKAPVDFSLNMVDLLYSEGYSEYVSIREQEEREAEYIRQQQHSDSYKYIGYVGGDVVFNNDGTITTSVGTYELVDTLTVNASAYCPCVICCEEYATGYTADGSKATAGYTLAAPSIYPFGTLFYIPYFDRVFEVEDRGGAIQDNRIDIYFDTHYEALQFGRQYITIYRIK